MKIYLLVILLISTLILNGCSYFAQDVTEEMCGAFSESLENNKTLVYMNMGNCVIKPMNESRIKSVNMISCNAINLKFNLIMHNNVTDIEDIVFKDTPKSIKRDCNIIKLR